MKIEVSFYGHLKEIVGQEKLQLTSIYSTNELLEKLNTLYPVLINKTFIIAVNNKLIKQNTILENENLVALMPPFSGG